MGDGRAGRWIGLRKAVAGGARSRNSGRRSGCIDEEFQKLRPSPSSFCLDSQSHAQSLKARDALLLWFIRRVAVARAAAAARGVTESSARTVGVLRSEGGCRCLVVAISPEKALSGGNSGFDVMRSLHATTKAEWLSEAQSSVAKE
jgi:hypothetical protein